MALALAIMVPSFVGCDFDQDGAAPLHRDGSLVPDAQDVSMTPESVASMLSRLPLSITQVREVRQAVGRSSAHGYDEEYPFSNLVGCCTVKRCAIVDNVKHLVVNLLRKILEHLLLVEYVLAEELRWTLCRCWDFDWLLLESLSYYLKS